MFSLYSNLYVDLTQYIICEHATCSSYFTWKYYCLLQKCPLVPSTKSYGPCYLAINSCLDISLFSFPYILCYSIPGSLGTKEQFYRHQHDACHTVGPQSILTEESLTQLYNRHYYTYFIDETLRFRKVKSFLKDM
jgi:hypothetical protein